MNEGRRKLFKAAFFGGVGFLAWKFFGGQLMSLAAGSVSGDDDLKGLNAKSDGERVVFFDGKTGEEIFILDNEE